MTAYNYLWFIKWSAESQEFKQHLYNLDRTLIDYAKT